MADLREISATEGRIHPWEAVRIYYYAARLRRLFTHPIQALDAGCGDATFSRHVLAALPAGSHITGWDPMLDEAQAASLRTVLPAAITLTREEPQQRFGLVLCMDMLEHVPDDVATLTHLVQERLAPGGWVMISVPAWPRLFSRHDLELHHYRRYSRKHIRQTIAASGLHIHRSGGLFHAAALARGLQVAIQGREMPLEHPATYQAGAHVGLSGFHMPETLAALYQLALRTDAAFSRILADCGCDTPGLSWWALAKRA